MPPDAGPYQTLYRRFRPQRFDEVLGQDHVTTALRNAVRDGRVGHAYLFSGPRGTGKTSSARILAKALNCESPSDGEPCGKCVSCEEITRGASLDVHELDAASNNGVDAMRELVARAALGTPGRWKLYIVDEVHMLSTQASNALLKTLEEPPGHVVFVLATTDPQKVLPTIRSRTQHFEFRLLGPDTLVGLVHDVADAAAIGLDDEVLAQVARRGRGSARDALSVLDQVAAGGWVDDEKELVVALAGALAERDAAQALAVVARATSLGWDPARLASELADELRQGFLATMAPELVHVIGEERARVEAIAGQLGLAGLVRVIELLGKAQVDMRDAPDPRVHFEVALVRVARPEADDGAAALAERVESLERRLASLGSGASPEVVPAPTPEVPSAAEPGGSEPAPPAAPAGGSAPGTSGPDLARRALGAVRKAQVTPPPRAEGSASRGPGAQAVLDTPAPDPQLSPGPGSTGSGVMPDRDTLVQVWGDQLLAALPGRARARVRMGRFLAVEGNRAVLALPNATHRSYCEEVRIDVERALSEHFGVGISLDLVVEEQPDAPASGAEQDTGAAVDPGPGSRASAEVEPDLLDPEVFAAETAPAGAPISAADQIRQAFPGAQEA